MTLIFARHAESEANVVGGLHCSVQGPGLSPVGFTQAEALAETLRNADLRAVYASTMTRAQQTAVAVARQHHLDVQVLAGLQETYLGDLDTRVDDDAHQLFDELFTAWLLDDALARSRPGGETGTQILSRLRTALAEILARHGDLDGDVLVVGHGAALRLVLSRVCEDISPAFALRHHLPNTATVLVEPIRAGTGFRLVCRSWGGLAPQG